MPQSFYVRVLNLVYLEFNLFYDKVILIHYFLENYSMSLLMKKKDQRVIRQK
jgi:hypothetical protein